MKFKLIFFALIAVSAFACKKDKIAPTLSINSPGDGAQAKGIVVIKGTVTDANLQTLTLKLTNDATGAERWSKTLSVDGLETYSFDEQYDPGLTVIAATNVTLTVEVSDKNSAKTSKIIKFTLVP